jgi:enamine deaminase RidA (YjgF/YER057c/UK114 family)
MYSGQTATGDDGAHPTTSDMAEQIEKAFGNLTKVVKSAGMTMPKVVKLTVYTTDVDELRPAGGKSHRSPAAWARSRSAATRASLPAVLAPMRLGVQLHTAPSVLAIDQVDR